MFWIHHDDPKFVIMVNLKCMWNSFKNIVYNGDNYDFGSISKINPRSYQLKKHKVLIMSILHLPWLEIHTLE